MFTSPVISRFVFFNFKVHNTFSTPLFRITNEENSIKLQVNTSKEHMYILKTVLSNIVCLILWIQLCLKYGSFKTADVIVALFVNGSLTLHIIFEVVHFIKRHEIANIFNNFVSFESRHKGNQINFINHNFNVIILKVVNVIRYELEVPDDKFVG